MIKNGMYYITEDFKQLIRNLGGEWNDQKKRPIVCLMQSTEHPDLYWAIPVGKVNHRDDKAMERIKSFMNKPTRDLRCCYYHIGRTTNKSIFFISDAIPITDKYISEEHLGSDNKLFVFRLPEIFPVFHRRHEGIASSFPLFPSKPENNCLQLLRNPALLYYNASFLLRSLTAFFPGKDSVLPPLPEKKQVR